MFPVRFTCDVEGEVSVLFAPESFGWLRPVIILLDVFFPLFPLFFYYFPTRCKFLVMVSALSRRQSSMEKGGEDWG
jgi:hypothetical protein